MIFDSHTRIHIEQPGKPRLYQLYELPGYETIGVVTLGSRAGALVRNWNSGIYYMATAGVLRLLDQRRIKAALGISNGAGAPARLNGGGRKNVYLDAESIKIARQLGNGNLSEGIRIALKQTKG
ncbi:hypothetical protein [Chromobacterium sphagni]|uniref:Uncharacterized protein n=1 Tax=Chromobacterium sphagni TaxID=1903179 RepID=A0A1S1WT34_9NEIS|nr:hypothetical protein [Chromobacterium sphagni]OHX10401.1 hypothetical protein BI347_21695 [Chromobacterium sphagni]OHX19554.1 hypothetical protein BI344_17775 [Chromobacterium sphagni]